MREITRRFLLMTCVSTWLTSVDVKRDGLQVDVRQRDCSLDQRTVVAGWLSVPQSSAVVRSCSQPLNTQQHYFSVRMCTYIYLLHDIKYCPVATALLLLLNGGHRRQKHSLAHSPVCRTTEAHTNTMRYGCGIKFKTELRKHWSNTSFQLGISMRCVADYCHQLQRWGGQ